MRVQLSAIVVLSSMLAASAVHAEDVSAVGGVEGKGVAAKTGSDFMRIYGPAQPPHGFVRVCGATPGEFASDHGQESRFEASAERLKELDEINRTVNTEVAPATDLEVYGVNEYWTLPRTRGDCEDYALLKRHKLIEKGWPVSAVL